jgi:hypothetical protein
VACQGQLEQEAVAGPLNLRDIALKGCPRPKDAPQHVRLSELTSNPDRYNGIFVSVSGQYYSGFERSALFPPSDTDLHTRTADEGVWLLQMDKSLAGERVQVSGIFTTRIKGHLRQWPGSICVVDKAKVVRKPGSENN